MKDEGMVRCVACDDWVDPENPFMSGAVYVRNPRTFRMAWMCGYCYELECETAEQTAATTPIYENRLDELLDKWQ